MLRNVSQRKPKEGGSTRPHRTFPSVSVHRQLSDDQKNPLMLLSRRGALLLQRRQLRRQTTTPCRCCSANAVERQRCLGIATKSLKRPQMQSQSKRHKKTYARSSKHGDFAHYRQSGYRLRVTNSSRFHFLISCAKSLLPNKTGCQSTYSKTNSSPMFMKRLPSFALPLSALLARGGAGGPAAAHGARGGGGITDQKRISGFSKTYT